MSRDRLAITGIVVAALAVSGLALAAEQEAKPKRETITANVINMTPGPGPNTGRITIWIETYSTEDEIRRYIEAFNQGGQEAVVKLWQKEKPVAGRMRFSQTLGYDLRAARSIPTENGRKIRVATDRPISGFEIMRGGRSEDYPIAWIEIDFDSEGKGEGTMIAAAELEAKDGNLVMKSYGTQPLKLVNAKINVE